MNTHLTIHLRLAIKPFLIAIAMLLVLSSLGLTNLAQADSKPNIVYFLVDDLGYADCGFNGGTDIRTPNIDRLAKEGAVLKSFYVQPVCSPTRSALMTGRHVTHTGVYNVVRPGAPWGLPLTERLLPQALREAGYTTAICGKWHLGEFQPEYMPTRRGFDHQYGHMFGAIDYFEHNRDGKPDWYRDDKPLVEEGYSTHLVAKEACRIIKQNPAGKPLFLYVPFNGIHGPHQVPPSYMEPYQGLPKTRRLIAGMLSAVDEAVGQINAAIVAQGLDQNTLFIFSSDNGGPGPGTATMNTPLRAGKGTIYEGGIRVCAFATWAGKIAAGVTIDEPMHAVDWYPTLLKLTGAPAAQKLPPDGLDIWPVLTTGAKSPHEAILLPGMRPSAMALRMGDWKLLVNASDKGATDKDIAEPVGNDLSPGKMELYNLANDIAEQHNLAASQPQRVTEMRMRLDALIKDAVPPGGTAATITNAESSPGKPSQTALMKDVSSKTKVSIVGEDFHINGQPTYAGRSWNGHRIEGLLLNSRMVQATYDDLNPDTSSRWVYADTGKWDAERNVREFIAAMPQWKAKGLLAVTVNFQGGSPEGYSEKQTWLTGAFNSDGTLRPDFADRMRRVLDAADENGMVVILGYFYFGQDQQLQDEAAVVRATDEATRWLLAGGWGNVIVEVNNETNVKAYDHEILRPGRVHELIERVRDTQQDGRRLLVGTSYGGGTVPKENVVRVSDFLLLHGNGVKDPNRIVEMVKQTRAVPGYKSMPILFNEDDHENFDQAANNFTAAISQHVSWGWFDYRRKGEGLDEGYQSPPVNWGISSDRKRAFFDFLSEVTGAK